MTSSLDTSPAARETPRPRLGRPVVLSSLRVLVAVTLVLAVAAGGYVAVTHHEQQARERARRHARISEVRDAVVALAAGHTVYAPAAWDARQYPSLDDGRIVSWGTYGAVTVHLYQVRSRDISASTSRLRHLTSLATPESLCLTAAGRTGHGRGGGRGPAACTSTAATHGSGSPRSTRSRGPRTCCCRWHFPTGAAT